MALMSFETTIRTIIIENWIPFEITFHIENEWIHNSQINEYMEIQSFIKLHFYSKHNSVDTKYYYNDNLLIIINMTKIAYY